MMRRGPHRQGSDSDITEELTEDQEVQIFAKQLLINRIFLGHYQERRLVESLKSYRDVVVVSTCEFDLKKDLELVRKRLRNYPRFRKTWIGITGPECVGAPAGHAMWVKLKDLPFGQYWFQIRQVKFLSDEEMQLRIKCIRAMDVASLNERGDYEPLTRSKPLDSVSETSSEPSVDWKRVKGKMKANLIEGTESVVSLMTVHNVKEAICFLCVLVVACITGLLHSIRYLGDYSLRFMREFSHVIHATTPIFLAIIDFFAKLVGGFYLLIAMMWRTSGQRGTKPLPPPNRFSNFQSGPRAIEMPYKWHKR